MPGGDGTGPLGMGSMTGRRAGFCSGFATTGYTNAYGRAVGFGCGQGFRRMYYATGIPGWSRGNIGINRTYEPLDEKELLSRQAEIMEDQLQQLKNRLSSLNKSEE
jgi:hypothetical protein